MEIAIDITASLREHGGTPGEALADKGFDWNGLHARCAAAHATRRALAAGVTGDSGGPAAVGSFDRRGGCSTPFDQASRVVNPNDLADRKVAAGKDDGVAQFALPGGRG